MFQNHKKSQKALMNLNKFFRIQNEIQVEFICRHQPFFNDVEEVFYLELPSLDFLSFKNRSVEVDWYLIDHLTLD